MEKRELTCIGCPMGCQITVEMDGQEIKKISGNSCKIGENYSRQEVTHPERCVTSTMIVTGGDKPRVSVKTKGNIPKDQITACMKLIDSTIVSAPVSIGDVLIPDVVGTGIDVVATRNIAKN
jgi:CxxC motif-containing protein